MVVVNLPRFILTRIKAENREKKIMTMNTSLSEMHSLKWKY